MVPNAFCALVSMFDSPMPCLFLFLGRRSLLQAQSCYLKNPWYTLDCEEEVEGVQEGSGYSEEWLCGLLLGVIGELEPMCTIKAKLQSDKLQKLEVSPPLYPTLLQIPIAPPLAARRVGIPWSHWTLSTSRMSQFQVSLKNKVKLASGPDPVRRCDKHNAKGTL